MQNKSGHIEQLIKQGENKWVDFKFEISDSRKIARSICAFANTEGGRLLVGVKDNGAIAGVRSEEEMYMIEAAAQMYCEPSIDFKARLWKIAGKDLLEIIIPELEYKGCCTKEADGKKLAWHRVHDQNLLAPSSLRKYWRLSKERPEITIRFDEHIENLIKLLNSNQKITLSAFVRHSIIPHKKAEDLLVKLVLLKILKMEFSETATYFSFEEEGSERLEKISSSKPGISGY